MAEANNPYVVNLLEYNEEDGIPYLVLEFVAGKHLGHLLDETGRLDETTALSIMAEVARGWRKHTSAGSSTATSSPATSCFLHPDAAGASPLGETAEFILDSAFDVGSVRQPDARTATIAKTGVRTNAAETAAEDSQPPRVKISDFGLARHVVDTESLALTAAGRLAGNAALHGARAMDRPCRRSPDRRLCDGRDAVSPARRPASVRRPRRATSFVAQHCNDPPPSLAALNPSVSEGVARVVETRLAKQPEDRYHRRRRDAARPRGPAARQADGPGDPSACCPTATRAGTPVRVSLGAGIIAAAALAAGHQYRPARPGDRVSRR